MNGVRRVVGVRMLERCHDGERSFFIKVFPLYSRANEIKKFIAIKDECSVYWTYISNWSLTSASIVVNCSETQREMAAAA